MRALICGLSLIVAGCADPAAQYKGNVFNTNQLNQRQEVKVVQILTIEPGQTLVDNASNQRAAAIGGAIFGAILGAAAGENSRHRGSISVAGAGLGATVASSAVGEQKLVDAVNLVYLEDGQALTSTQIGQPCEFALGSALVVTTKANEAVAGGYSKLGGSSVLPALANAGKGQKDTVSDIQRKKQIIAESRKLQKEITELNKEERRTETATERADIELETDQALVDGIRARNEATRNVGEGLSKVVDINVIK
jgi:outer membrane lipoprotein SlyB